MSAKPKSDLKRWLLLASRLLGLACLILAFSEPYLRSSVSHSSPNKVIGVYVDASMSMSCSDGEVTLFDRAKMMATQIIDQFSLNDTYILFGPEIRSQQLTQEQITDQVQSMVYANDFQSFASDFKHIKKTIKKNQISEMHLFIISDFQKNTFENLSESDSVISSFLVPIQGCNTENVLIDSVWFDTPRRLKNDQEKLHYSIRNTSENPYENIPLEFTINTQKKALSNISLGANQRLDSFMTFQSNQGGTQSGVLTISDGALSFDNSYYVSYFLEDSIKALCVYQKNDKYIKPLLENEPFVDLNTTLFSEVNLGELSEYDVLILKNIEAFHSGFSRAVDRFVSQGGTVVVFPPTTLKDFSAYNAFLKASDLPEITGLDTQKVFISQINDNTELLANVFENTPVRSKYGRVQNVLQTRTSSASTAEHLIVLENQRPFLSSMIKEKGRVYMFYAALSPNENSFYANALLVPVVLNAVYQSVFSPSYNVLFSKHIFFDVDLPSSVRSDALFSVDRYPKGLSVIPKVKQIEHRASVQLFDALDAPGNYSLRQEALTIPFSVNYNRQESDLTPLSEAQLDQFAEGLGAKILTSDVSNFQASVQGLQIKTQDIWWYFILCALLFFIAEMCIAKFLKV